MVPDNALDWFEQVCSCLNNAQCDYLIAGGIATVFHGNPRVTMDLDCYIDWERENALKTMSVLRELGFVLSQPVKEESLVDPAVRAALFEQKGMLVATFLNPLFPERVVDLLFEQSCLPFQEAKLRKVEMGGLECSLPTMSIDDLIVMKRAAGREKDIQDISVLESLKR